jgi:mRNA-degrading endonuclease HigB of HigAB toxin-antitoxin module
MLALPFAFCQRWILNVIGKREPIKPIVKHPQAETELLAWHKAARGSDWESLLDCSAQFSVGGSCEHVADHGRVLALAADYVKALLTHKQYDKKEWMKWAR